VTGLSVVVQELAVQDPVKQVLLVTTASVTQVCAVSTLAADIQPVSKYVLDNVVPQVGFVANSAVHCELACVKVTQTVRVDTAVTALVSDSTELVHPLQKLAPVTPA
tara:strand:+ start:3402 stop:3722 length:321 start_codon:yes stop_codon:yes gene_type:complete